MTEEEARDYRSSITHVLGQHHLGWITDQADEKISLGRLVTKRVDTASSVQDPITGQARRAPRRTMTEFLSSEPYSETERLGILLDAVELGLIAPVKMERALAENLGATVSTIHFRSEDGGAVPQHDIDLTAAAASSRAIFAEALRQAIDHIRALL